MSLGVAGLNHRTAPIAVRERFHIEETASPGLAAEILRRGAEECVLLCTCNRTECYFTAEVAEAGERAAVEALSERAGMDPGEAEASFFFHRDEAAVFHLYRVVSGLDSLVLGEPQIQGQVREAYRSGRSGAPDSVGPVLHRLFQSALGAGGRARAASGISAGSASVPSAAVELAGKVLGSLEGRRALVLGAGKMGGLTLRCLSDAGVDEILVASRSFDRASRTGRRAGVRPIPYREFQDRIPQVDVVVTSAAAPHPLLTARGLAAARRSAADPLVVLDIALPRNVEAGVGDLPGVFLYNIDDLQRVVEAAEARRADERPVAEEILREHARRFWSWYRARRAVPVIRRLRERAERIRVREIEDALDRIGDLTPEERERIHMASRAALNKILHGPTTALRELAREEDGEELLEAARRLFGRREDGEEGDDGSG